jgi:hypothetical protein
LQAGQRVLIVDEPKYNSASRVSAGLMNPVTGKRFVKSCEIETCLPIAITLYRQLEKALKIHCLKQKQLIRRNQVIQPIKRFYRRLI